MGVNIKALLQDISGSKSVITEKDLSVDEILALKKIVLTNLARGKTKIEYADYQTTKTKDPYQDVAGNGAKKGYGTNNDEAWNQQSNPSYRLKSFLGQSQIVIRNGQIQVVDSYDFNDATSARANKSKIQIFKDFMAGAWGAGTHPYKQARNIGTYYGSAPGEGIPIQITIKRFKNELL